MSSNQQTVVVSRQDDFNFLVNEKPVRIAVSDIFRDPVLLTEVPHKVAHLSDQERNAFQNWINQNHNRRVNRSIYSV